MTNLLTNRFFWIAFFVACTISFIGGLTRHPLEAFSLVGMLLLLGLYLYFSASNTLFKANAAYKRRDFETALQICEKILSKNPRDINALLSASAAGLAQHQLPKALELCDSVIALSPNNSIAWSNRAAVHAELSDAESAISDATRAITLNKKHAQAYMNRASAYIMAYQYEKALEDSEYLMAMGRASQSKMIRAIVDDAKNNLDEAFEACNNAINQGEQPLPFWLVIRGYIYSKRCQLDKAILDFTKALELDPSYSLALNNRSYARCMMKQYDQANSDITLLLQKPVSNYLKAFALSNRARINLAQGRLDDALDDVTAAIVLAPNSASILSTRGLVLTRKHLNEEALADLNRAIYLDHFCAEAHWFRGELYEAMGKGNLALADKKIAEAYQYMPYL